MAKDSEKILPFRRKNDDGYSIAPGTGRITLPDGRVAQVDEGFAAEFGINNLNQLVRAGDSGIGGDRGIPITIDGEALLYFPQSQANSPAFRSADIIPMPGGGVAVRSAGFNADHKKTDSLNKQLAMLTAAIVTGGAGLMGGAGAGAGLSADAIGLTQMGQAAGLSGPALEAFVASGGAANIGIPAATAAGGMSAADIAGLRQMGAAAGLEGPALDAFVSGGGTAGSTAAGGGGIGTGARTIGNTIIKGAKEVAPTLGTKVMNRVEDAAIGAGLSAAGGLIAGDPANTDPFIEDTARDEATKNALVQRIRSIFGEGNPEALAAFNKEETDLASALRGQYGDELGKRYGESERQLRFGAARTGNIGGSEYSRAQSQLDEENQLGGTRIEDAVRRAVEGLKSGRESAKISAINLANSGAGEGSVLAAQHGLDAARQNAQSGQREQLFTDLLGDISFAKTAGGLQNRDAQLLAYLNAARNRGGSASPGRSSPTIISTS